MIPMKEIINAINNFYFDIDNYTLVDFDVIEVCYDRICVEIVVEIHPNIYKDTSNLDYFNGTGYSCELIEKGHFELISFSVYLDGDLIKLNEQDKNTIKEAINNKL